MNEQHGPSSGLVQRFWRSRVRSFSIIGILLTIGGGVFIALVPEAAKDQANLIQAVVSVVLNFILNYHHTWQDREISSPRNRFFLRFVPAKVATIWINQRVFELSRLLFRQAFGEAIVIGPIWLMSDFLFAYGLSTGIIMVINYSLMDDFVFGARGYIRDFLAMVIRLAKWSIFPLRFLRNRIISTKPPSNGTSA